MDYCITVGGRCNEGERLTVSPYADRPRLRELERAREQETEQETTTREELDVGYTAPSSAPPCPSATGNGGDVSCRQTTVGRSAWKRESTRHPIRMCRAAAATNDAFMTWMAARVRLPIVGRRHVAQTLHASSADDKWISKPTATACSALGSNRLAVGRL